MSEPTGDLMSRAMAAEARVTELEAERDALKAQLTELEAQAAAMREALREFEWVCIDDGLTERVEAAKKARAALSGDAGRAMLERMKRLEAVADAAKRLCEEAAVAKAKGGERG